MTAIKTVRGNPDLSHATPKQLRVFSAFNKFGSITRAAKDLKCDRSTVRHHLRALGVLPEQVPPNIYPLRAAPEGFGIKGTSTMVGKDGEVKIQWVKTDKERSQQLQAFFDSLPSLLKPIRAKSSPVRLTVAPGELCTNTMPMILLGDPHFGMLAWAEECGENFDSDICEFVTVSAVDNLVSRSTPAQQCVIMSVGDTFHADSSKPLTPQSGHLLDVDSRFRRVFPLTLRAFKTAINRALEVHGNVLVYIVPGNHDPTLSICLAWALHEYYAHEKRVTVDVGAGDRRYLRFGQNLVGFTHGEKQGHGQLPGIMAAERKVDWGQTDFRFWFLGHIHKKLASVDVSGVQMTHLRTQAALDAYAAGMGFVPIQDTKMVTLHRDFGEVSSATCSKVMLDQKYRAA